ncbi:MAG: c-type cytochrome [Methylococcaceae bacterium]
MNKKAMTLAFTLIALLSFQTATQAADIQAGKDAFETCRGCHSAPGYSNVYPTYYVPKIGGQVPAYTVAALKAYKESNRSHRTMMANSYDLSEQKMEDIAAYLAEATGGSKESKSNHGDITKGKKLAETCLSCHNDDTSSNNPRLAGQHANYLEKAMQDYQSGERKNALMKSMVEDLSEDDIRDISAYFSSLKGLVATE